MNVRKLTLVEPGQVTARCDGEGSHTWVAVAFEGHRGYVSQPPDDGTTCMCGAWTWAEANDTCPAMAEWLKWSMHQGALS